MTLIDDYLDDRQRRMAALHCVSGHTWVRRHSVHLGRWRACQRCELVESLPDIQLLRGGCST